MLQVRTVLCPVDFSDATRKGVALAAGICERFGARLVVQHDVTGTPPSFMGTGWVYQASEANRELEADEEATRRLGELVEGLPKGIRAEWRLTQGPRRATILHLARELPADLLVMVSSGGADPGHVSVTEMVIEEAPCPVLALRADGAEPPRFLSGEKELSVVAAIDCAPRSENAVGGLLDLARTVPMKVHLVTAEPSKALEEARHAVEEGLEEDRRRRRAQEARTRLAGVVPPAVAASVTLGVPAGSPVRELLAEARKRSADLIVMGVHPKAPAGEATFGAASSDVLRQSPCPVWFVPERGRVSGPG